MSYYSATGGPGNRAPLSSAQIRAEFALIATGFSKLPNLTGNASKIVRVAADETTLEAVSVSALGMLPLAGGTMTGQIIGLSGSVGAPGYAIGAGNTGIWSPSAGAIAVSANGSEALRVISSGNIGVGVTSPAEKLSVAGGIKVQGPSVLGGTANQTLSYETPTLRLYIGDATGYDFRLASRVGAVTTDRLWFNDVGNTGFGAAPTNDRIVVRKASTIGSPEGSSALYANTGAGAGSVGILIGADTAATAAYIQSVEPTVSYTSRQLRLNPNGGSVWTGAAFGIGINPAVSFHVDVGAVSEIARWNSAAANGSFLRWQQAGTDIGYIGTGASLGITTSDFAFVAGSGKGLKLLVNNDPATGISVSTVGVAVLASASNPQYIVNRTAGTGDVAFQGQLGGVTQGYFAFAGSASGMVAGSASGDMVLRTQAKNINFTIDAGASIGMQLDTAGRLSGNSWHNNASGMSGTARQFVGSGTYTPTVAASSNAGSPTVTQAQWIRVGNVVSVSGHISNIAPTTAGAIWNVFLTLPIASTLSSLVDLNGVANGLIGTASESGAAIVAADTTNNRALFQGLQFSTSATGYWYQYQYEVK